MMKMKLIGGLVVMLFLVSMHMVAGDEYDHASDRRGPCGKYSTERMLTHKLRHCEKAARDLYAAVSPQCCNDLRQVSIPCLYAVFSSDAFKNVGVNPHIAVTIPARCHHNHPPTTTAHP